MNSFLQKHVPLSTYIIVSGMYLYAVPFLGNHIIHALGIFVPIGPNIIILTIGGVVFGNLLYLCVIALIFFWIWKLDTYFENLYLSVKNKILITLGMLFCLTLSADLILFKEPVSILYLFDTYGLLEQYDGPVIP